MISSPLSSSLLPLCHAEGLVFLLCHSDDTLPVVTTKDQDPLISHHPLIGVDVWEHAYYLQVSSVLFSGQRQYVCFRDSPTPLTLLMSNSTRIFVQNISKPSGRSSTGLKLRSASTKQRPKLNCKLLIRIPSHPLVPHICRLYSNVLLVLSDREE